MNETNRDAGMQSIRGADSYSIEKKKCQEISGRHVCGLMKGKKMAPVSDAFGYSAAVMMR